MSRDPDQHELAVVRSEAMPAVGQPANESPRENALRKATPAEDAAAQMIEQEATIINRIAFPAMMAAALGLDQFAGPNGFRAHLDQLLKDAGNPSDPIERMLIEQFAFAHLRIVQLQVSAAKATNPELVKAYNGAASRLLGELRRLALSLRSYRQPIAPKHFTVVKQQNVATGDQQVAYIDQKDGPPKVPSADGNIKLGSKSKATLNYVPDLQFTPEPEACRRRQTKLVETERPDRQRP